MDPAQRIVTHLPLLELWNDHGSVNAVKVREIGGTALRDLLSQGVVRFVVADVGGKLRWLAETECFRFWKQEVQTHLAEPGQHVELKTFPDDKCYFASEWSSPGPPIVLLECCH